jgi:hypothetical protein
MSRWRGIAFCLLLSPSLHGQVERTLIQEGETVTTPTAYAQPGSQPAGAGSVSRQNFRPSNLNHGDGDRIRPSYRPHLYLGFGGSVMPGGYATLAGFGRAGFEVENRAFMADAYAAYDNGHKVNDNDQPNPKGHDRYLRGGAYWRLGKLSHPNWFLGAGYGWNQLSTSNYTKGASRPQFGGGYDLYHQGSGRDCLTCGLSARLIVNWVMAGTDWQNGSHGPEFEIVFPRPLEKHHFFLTTQLGVYRFHTTVTEPDNLELTRQQRGQRSMYGTCSTGLMYRFW